MITEALVSWIDRGIAAGYGVLPDVPVNLQEFFTTAPDQVAGYSFTLQQWGFLLPWDVFGVSIAITVAALLLGITIRLVRIVISYLTLGGGM